MKSNFLFRRKSQLLEDDTKTGCIEGDCQNGKGTITYPDGKKYVGEFKDGKYNGQGTETYPKGDKYVGEFKDNEFNGHGTYTWSHGDVYVGNWKDGLFDGQGTYTWSDGTKYVGNWKDDDFNGQGTYTNKSGCKFSGEWIDGKLNGKDEFDCDEITNCTEKPLENKNTNETPIPCTVVDILVVDESNTPVPNVRMRLFFKNNEVVTSNFKFIKTDSNGEFKNIMIGSGESVFLSTDKDKIKTLERYFANCNKKEPLKIQTKHERNKKTFTQDVCTNNAYFYNSNPDEPLRFETTASSNKLKIILKKSLPEPKPEPEPEVEKDYNFRGCTRITRKLYRQMREIVLGNREMEDLDTNEVVKLRTAVEKCVHKYYKQYEKEKPEFEKTVISSLMNVTPEMKIFELRFTPRQIRDIYGESRTMSLNNTIRKVIFESSEKKNLIKEEKKLIKNRFLFSINDLNLNNRRQFNESKKRLNNETINLIRRGYNQRLVKETLLDVMQSLYGGDGTNVITDFKTKLGEKIATQVKNKEEEHSMILSAFNDLPEDMVERAIKENRVDELSSEIATRAMEMYKGQYGTEGLSGLMFASVDENKFKQEVAKLLEPAINDITTKMDEKFKEIQNAVGGITKTA